MKRARVFAEGTMTLVIGPPADKDELAKIRVYAGPNELLMACRLKLEANLDNGAREMEMTVASPCGIDDIDLTVEQNLRLLSAFKWLKIRRE